MHVKDIVSRGIDALNDYWGGTGWLVDIDLTTLDMADPERCVLGQIWGGFGIGSMALGLRDGIEAAIYGFEAFYDCGTTYNLLQTEWMYRLREMKGQ